MQSDLIFDFGVNNGRDTEFYLSKGFRVIGIEANPTLYSEIRDRMAKYIANGQLIILNVGVWHEPKTLNFYVNLDNDHWSSFDPHYGQRENTRFETILINCYTTIELIRRFGLPYYMKIDVEGADKYILADLKNNDHLPEYISVEEFGVQCIELLHELSYTKFKVVPQRDKTNVTAPNPPAEGTYAPRVFDGTDSGLFGKELPGEWLSYSEAREYFIKNVRNENYEWVGPQYEWFDVHATR